MHTIVPLCLFASCRRWAVLSPLRVLSCAVVSVELSGYGPWRSSWIQQRQQPLL
jgi:hypothetical protein